MENKEIKNDEVLFFDTNSSINNLTGDEIYFYSNDDTIIYKNNNSHKLQKGTSVNNNLNALEKKDETVKKINEYNEKEFYKKKISNLNKNSDGEINCYFSENVNKKQIFEEREKFVFEHEFNKISDIYNTEEIMKIINNLNSIRKEIETVIYKKLEKKYINFLVSTVKIKNIENYITNIKDLLSENMSELKILQKNKYKESLDIIHLFKKKKRSKKINLVILIIYVIYIYDKLIFKNILKRDYEYSSVVFYELLNFLNDNILLLNNINCVCNLKEKMFSTYFNRLKQNNQTNFVDFLFSNNSKKNLETQLEKSIKIYYLLSKSKSYNFIDNFLAYVYQCFQKISKQIIFSFIIVNKKKEKEKKKINNDKNEISFFYKNDSNIKENIDYLENFFHEKDKEMVNNFIKVQKKVNNSLNEKLLKENTNNKNLSISKHFTEKIPNYENIDMTYSTSNFDNIFFSINDNINESHIFINENSDNNLSKEKKKGVSTNINKRNENFENEINQFQEDNFLFIPLNELVQKLKEKDSLVSLIKIYEIVFDILNKYDFMIIYLLNCSNNIGSNEVLLEETNDSIIHKEKIEKILSDDHNKSSIYHSKNDQDDICFNKNIKKNYNNLYDKKIENEKYSSENLKTKNSHDAFSFYDIYSYCKSKNSYSNDSKLYEANNYANSFITTFFLKDFNIENCSFSENCLKIKKKIENYLKDKSMKYNHCNEFLNFTLDNADKLLNSKEKFLKNIEKVIKTIIENMQFHNFSFNYIFGFIVITIIFCFNSFLFKFNCSNNKIYKLKKTKYYGTEKKENQSEHKKNIKKKSNILEKKESSENYIYKKNDKIFNFNTREEKKKNEENIDLTQDKTEKKTELCLNSKDKEKMTKKYKKNLTSNIEILESKQENKNNETKNEKEKLEKENINTNIIDNQLNIKDNENNKNKGYISNIGKKFEECYNDEFVGIDNFKKENMFLSELKNDIIFEEMEKKIKNYFSKYFYINIKKLNDVINKDNWMRIPIRINYHIFNKKFNFFKVISFYKKTFYDFLNKPFSENPLKNFNFKNLEDELCFDKDLNECVNYNTKSKSDVKLVDELNNVTLDSVSDIENMYDNYDDEKCEESNLNKEKNELNNFEIVNFDTILSNSSNVLASILQNYFILKELLYNLKEEINEYIFRIIDFYLYIICSFFMKRKNIEELIIDLKKYSDKLSINNIFFIIKKQEKYKGLYNFLIFHNEEIKKNIDKYNFLRFNKNESKCSQAKYDLINFNNTADNSSQFFYLNNFCKIHSSTSLYALSEKIISIESLFCLISKLKEEIIKKYDNLKKKECEKKYNDNDNKNDDIKSKNGINIEHLKEKNKKKDEKSIFLNFLDKKLSIIDELRILIYCDSLYDIIESNNYINEILKIINEIYSEENKNKTGINDLNTKKKDLKKKLDQYMNLYLNILNDTKRKIMFCCEGVLSIVIHYLLWNLINYIFNLNNIEIVYKIKRELMPVINKNHENNKTRTNEINHNQKSSYISRKKEPEEKLQKNSSVILLNKCNKKNSKVKIIKTANEFDDYNEEDKGYLMPILKSYFYKISNVINQNINNLEKEIEQNVNNDIKMKNNIYTNFYKDLKNPHNKNYQYYYIFLSKGVSYFEHYLDLHFYNLDKVENLIRSYNSDFYQYKHIHSIILKYHYFKKLPESYIVNFEKDILKRIQNKIKSQSM
ncbi:conserved Plasmodium protein, unknown function [Plasmodium relictum]|uniref:Uncharacterized protein n=1 Tax=Plasmodium relictum TaxID=85471 RepID=A0A1J1H445_PLARL|nr:conserved Plasmodium protein, unknown function [Plasmodium relictum]CRG98360.1 conserved Plasmodium protein, unknown function [Plasmodium relictum]